MTGRPQRTTLLLAFLLSAGVLYWIAPGGFAESEPDAPAGVDVQIQPEDPAFPGRERRVTVDLRDSDLVDMLRYFAKRGGFNVFITEAVKGRVSLYLRDVPVSEVLDIILESHSLAWREEGSILYVMTQDEYRARYGEEFGGRRRSETFRLRYADPAQLFRMLEPVKSRGGTVVMDEKTGNVLLADSPGKVEEMLSIVKEFDRPLVTKVFALDYAKAADVQSLLASQSDAKNVVSMKADARSNQLVVTAPPLRMREIARLLARIDRKTREVAIDTQIVKIDLTDESRRGIDWRYLFQRGALESLEFNANLPQTLASFGSIGYGVANNDSLQFVVNFLRSLGDSKILASPRITVVEGDEAKILIGTREAYVTTTTTTSGGGVVSTAESVQFVDVGISLRVAPVINREGYVTMKIKPEVSSVTRVIETPSDSQIPIVDTTQAETRVMVKDGATLVIGGLRKDEKIIRRDKVPVLGDIPVLGWFFSNRTDDLEQSEIVVFLTPRIVKDRDPALEGPLAGLKGTQNYGKPLSALVPPAPPSPPAPASGSAPGSGELELKGLQGPMRKG